jgi:hypothetical protein
MVATAGRSAVAGAARKVKTQAEAAWDGFRPRRRASVRREERGEWLSAIGEQLSGVSGAGSKLRSFR